MAYRHFWKYLLALALLVLGLLPVWHTRAGADFLLRKYTFANAGGFLQSSSYSLNLSLGQTSTVGLLSSGNFRLRAGYWEGGALSGLPEQHLFLPLVIR